MELPVSEKHEGSESHIGRNGDVTFVISQGEFTANPSAFIEGRRLVCKVDAPRPERIEFEVAKVTMRLDGKYEIRGKILDRLSVV